MTDITVVQTPVIVEVSPQVFEITVSSVGAQGSSGVINATAPITYNSTTKTVGLDETNLVKNNQANTITTGNQTILTGSDTNQGLVVRRNSASQSANLIEVTNSSGSSVIASVNGYGGLAATGIQNLQLTTDGVVTNNQYGFLATTNNLSQSLIDHTGIQANTLATWAANTPYIKGNLVQYQGIAYRRLSDGTSGATFNNAMWQQVTPTPTTSGANTLVLRDGSGGISATTLSASTVSAIQTSGVALNLGSVGTGSGNIQFGTSGGVLQVAAQSGGSGTLTLPTGGGTLATTASNITGTSSGISGTQTANRVYAAPDGSNGSASFRALAPFDLGVSYYAANGDFTMTESGQSAGTITSTGTNTKCFGIGVNLAANTFYEVDIFLPFVFSISGTLQPRFDSIHSGGLTFNSQGLTVTTQINNNTETTIAAVTTGVRYFSGTTQINTMTLTAAALSTTLTPYAMKTFIKGVMRTSAAGNWALTFYPSANSMTGVTIRNGGYMKFTNLGSGSASPLTSGSWS